MIKRHKRQRTPTVYYRTNERIFAQTMRVLDSEGKQVGILSKYEALTRARSEGLDLVEVAPTAKPPVARIIDFKKFLYQQQKKKREEKRKAKVSETKEVRLGPFMDDHDLDVMVRRAREFIGDNDKVRLVVKFKGRQIAHPEFGQAIIKKVVSSLADTAKLDKDPHFEGKQLVAILSPEKKKSGPAKPTEGKGETYEQEKNQESNQQAIQNNQKRESAL